MPGFPFVAKELLVDSVKVAGVLSFGSMITYRSEKERQRRESLLSIDHEIFLDFAWINCWAWSEYERSKEVGSARVVNSRISEFQNVFPKPLMLATFPGVSPLIQRYEILPRSLEQLPKVCFNGSDHESTIIDQVLSLPQQDRSLGTRQIASRSNLPKPQGTET